MADEQNRLTEEPAVFSGRSRIVCTPGDITSDNVRQLLDRARLVHAKNASDIDYLRRYFLGYQPVLKRVKEVRPDIRNVVVENRAYQIAKDRADSLTGEPIAYSAHSTTDSCEDAEKSSDLLSHKVQRLNDCCVAADKHACDMEIVQWMCICGVGYRLIMPNPGKGGMDRDKPFRVACLDPRSTFVVYANDVFHEPLFADTYVKHEVTGELIHTLYTADSVFTITDSTVEQDPNPLGMVPIIEYTANSERMGVFEAVLSLLDAINEVESNRVDGIAQFVQSLMVLENVEFESDDSEKEFAAMLKLGCIYIRSTDENKASVQMLTAELNQDQTQTLVDELYKTVLSICGMPFNVGGSASTSDTGVAVTMRDGWSNSESRCKETEIHFKRGERLFLRAALSVLETTEHLGLNPMDVEIKFTRRNYEAIQSKAQVLTTLLGSGKVHPRLCFEYCGMFPDPESAYDLSRQYAEELQARSVELFQKSNGTFQFEDTKAGTGVKDPESDKGPSGPEGNEGGGDNAAGEGKQPPSSKRSQGKE